jgi:hypothetical protein
MARFTLAEIDARLVEVRAAISKARLAQSATAGAGMSLQRGTLKTLIEEEQWLLAERDKLESGSSNSGGGMFNRARFQDPVG